MNREAKEETGEIIIYNTGQGEAQKDVRTVDETVWLSQSQLSELYQTSKTNISEHIKHKFDEKELEENSVVRNFRTTASDGKQYNVLHYNLGMGISLGYRIKSKIATQFRKWATERLKEYMSKGFTMDDKRLKNLGGGKYWEELLERIRDIRSSEKVMYRWVLDLYVTSVDDDPKSAETKEFFKIIQDKLHYVVQGQTVAEKPYIKEDTERELIGTITFNDDFPTKKKSSIKKNYLSEEELKELERVGTAYFDIAEAKAIKQKSMYMRDYLETLDDLLRAKGKNVPIESKTTSHQEERERAGFEYEKHQKEKNLQVEKECLERIRSIERIANKAGQKNEKNR